MVLPFVAVLRVAAGAMRFVPFLMSAFGDKDGENSVIKLTVGLDVEGGLQNAGGDLPDVRLFNEAGKFLGINADPGDISEGTTAEIKVKHKKDLGQQAAYALFSANDNAICVATISITWPNGDQYGWVGDWGSECGGSWYYSNIFIQGTDYKPNCLWIDANGDQPTTGFQVHWPEFTNQNENQEQLPPGKDRDYFCTAGPPFKLYTSPDPRGITYWIPKSGKRQVGGATATSDEAPPRRTRIHNRRHSRRQEAGPPKNATDPTQPPPAHRFADFLVLDTAAEHSAAVLCRSETSVGPDFANHAEKLFCRMSDKTIWPFCDQARHITDNCFNTDLQQLVIGGMVARDTKYGRVLSWGSGGGKGDE